MIICIGSNGQLGSEIVKAADKLGMACVGLTHDDIEVTGDVGDFQFIVPTGSTTIINTAAYHDLSLCEKDPLLAWRVNAQGSGNLAWYCATRKPSIKYVYISTDYCHAQPLSPDGFPLSVYAKTKLAGELAALSICHDALVARVGTLYGATGCRAKGGSNFIKAILPKIKSGQSFTLPDYTNVYFTNARRAAYRILTNLSSIGVWYATDERMSHYQMGCKVCDMLGLPNHIVAVSHDPDDTLRPNESTEAVRLLQWYREGDPLKEYLLDEGEICE